MCCNDIQQIAYACWWCDDFNAHTECVYGCFGLWKIAKRSTGTIIHTFFFWCLWKIVSFSCLLYIRWPPVDAPNISLQFIHSKWICAHSIGLCQCIFDCVRIHTDCYQHCVCVSFCFVSADVAFVYSLDDIFAFCVMESSRNLFSWFGIRFGKLRRSLLILFDAGKRMMHMRIYPLTSVSFSNIIIRLRTMCGVALNDDFFSNCFNGNLMTGEIQHWNGPFTKRQKEKLRS